VIDPFIKTLGPCIVTLHGPAMEKNYGPFDSGNNAVEWMEHQLHLGNVRSFSVQPLRTPYREREHDDWWAGDWHQVNIADQEFPKEPWFSTKRRVLRKWRRHSRKLMAHYRAEARRARKYALEHATFVEYDDEFLDELAEAAGIQRL